MAANDLCTLADVKAWLGRSDANSDAVLAGLIARTSRQILSYLRRPTVLPHAVNEIRDGTGGETLVLREWPVLSISALTIGAQTILPAPLFVILLMVGFPLVIYLPVHFLFSKVFPKS